MSNTLLIVILGYKLEFPWSYYFILRLKIKYFLSINDFLKDIFDFSFGVLL